MPGCVLRISGPFDLLQRAMELAPANFSESVSTFRKRERGETGASDWATFNCTLSDDSHDGDLTQQAAKAEAFLVSNLQQMQQLLASPGVERSMLDFGFDFPAQIAGRCYRFPHSLLLVCGELHVDLEISVYATKE